MGSRNENAKQFDTPIQVEEVNSKMSKNMKCTETVSDDNWHFHQCGKKAKWFVRGSLRCGKHARLDNYYVHTYGRTPIKEGINPCDVAT